MTDTKLILYENAKTISEIVTWANNQLVDNVDEDEPDMLIVKVLHFQIIAYGPEGLFDAVLLVQREEVTEANDPEMSELKIRWK